MTAPAHLCWVTKNEEQGTKNASVSSSHSAIVSAALPPDRLADPLAWGRCVGRPFWVFRGNEGRSIEFEQLPQLPAGSLGELEQGFYSRVWFPACLDVLIIFGIQIGALSELLLREAHIQPELFYARDQALRRFVSHVRP